MKKMMLLAAMALSFGVTAGEVLFEEKFDQPEAAGKYYKGAADIKVVADADGKNALCINVPEKTASTVAAGVRLDVSKFAGKTVEFTASVKGENILEPKDAWNGGKFMLAIETPDKKDWPSAGIKKGSFDWETVKFKKAIPADAKSLVLTLGLQDSGGKIYFRDVKAEAVE